MIKYKVKVDPGRVAKLQTKIYDILEGTMSIKEIVTELYGKYTWTKYVVVYGSLKSMLEKKLVRRQSAERNVNHHVYSKIDIDDKV